MVNYSGKQKIAFCKQLGEKWQDLADYCEIPASDQNHWQKGEEAREIWEWLKQRKRQYELVEALNYIDRQDIVLEVFNSTKQDQTPKPSKIITGSPYPGSPYPGLRAFTEDESALFFGRTPEINALLNILSNNRFLAVIGSSGSGKSSLVNCGLMPALHRGLLASAGSSWPRSGGATRRARGRGCKARGRPIPPTRGRRSSR